MDVEPGAVIHGIPASALKAMLTKPKGRFTTPQAMADLTLVEPEATMAMLGLARDGYLDYVGRPNGVDVWMAGVLGRRLMASKIGKRFPAREGRQIAEAVVSAARKANADPESPVRVTWVALFGSTLDAADDAPVGDVDLIVRVHRRRLPKEDLWRLEEALLAAAPPSARNGPAPFRSTVAILDRLRRVSPKVSLMSASTLGLGVRHRAIYAYDVGKEAEVPASGRIRMSRADPDEGGSASEDGPAPPALMARPWPDRPAPRQGSEAGGPDTLARGDHLTAQHMWTRGLALAEISVRLGVPERTVQDYLAVQTIRPEGPLAIAASLRATLAANVPVGTAVIQEARAEIGRGRHSGVQVTLSHGPAACAGAVTGGAVTLITGDMSLAPFVERACAAAERWRQGASKAVRGVATTCHVGAAPVVRSGDVERGVPDLAALKSACEGWLRAAGPVRATFGSHGRSLSVELGDATGAKVVSPWDKEPSGDPTIMTEAARLNGELEGTGVRWTFWFSEDEFPVAETST